MKILPIASGKGGVGKSLIAANLAVALAETGQDVVLVDLDLGASNLHLMIGHRAPKIGIGSFLEDPKINFDQTVAVTDIPNLRFIPGDAEIPGVANLKPSQKNALARRLLGLDAEVLILDLGAGTHQTILDFFLLSGQGIIITTPTVTATLNAYLFLKNAVFRLMYSSFTRSSKAYGYIEQLRKDGSNLQKLYVPRLLDSIAKVDPVSWTKFKNRIDVFHPRLIMNMIDDPKDADKAQKIRRSCTEYLGIQLEHLGIIYRDSQQDLALAARIPMLLYKPQAILSQAIYRIADKLMQTAEEALPLSGREIDESFLEATIEAEVDFESKVSYLEDLLDCDELTAGELVETIRVQQFEISQLRKENNFLKSRLTKAMDQGFKP